MYVRSAHQTTAPSPFLDRSGPLASDGDGILLSSEDGAGSIAGAELDEQGITPFRREELARERVKLEIARNETAGVRCMETLRAGALFVTLAASQQHPKSAEIQARSFAYWHNLVTSVKHLHTQMVAVAPAIHDALALFTDKALQKLGQSILSALEVNTEELRHYADQVKVEDGEEVKDDDATNSDEDTGANGLWGKGRDTGVVATEARAWGHCVKLTALLRTAHHRKKPTDPLKVVKSMHGLLLFLSGPPPDLNVVGGMSPTRVADFKSGQGNSELGRVNLSAVNNVAVRERVPFLLRQVMETWNDNADIQLAGLRVIIRLAQVSPSFKTYSRIFS